MAITEISEGTDDRSKLLFPVDAKRYVLVVFPDDADFADDGQYIDINVELGEDFVGGNLSDIEAQRVGYILSDIAEQLFGYSQAKDILQNLYGAL